MLCPYCDQEMKKVSFQEIGELVCSGMRVKERERLLIRSGFREGVSNERFVDNISY